MPIVRGYNLPDDLLYDVENHAWCQEMADGNACLGMTTMATAVAGGLVAVRPKKAGRSVDPNQSCATVELGKRVGPAKSLTAGSVVGVNGQLVETPSLANYDHYGAGWLIILKPTNRASVKSGLVPGAQLAPKYEATMQADGFAGCAP